MFALAELVILFVLLVPVAAGVWTFRDARARGLESGPALGAALIVALMPVLGLALWLLLRDRLVPALTV